MDLERWTDIKLIDCPTVGFRVATAIAMTGVRNPDPGPEYFSVYGKLEHCTGALRCNLALPATVGDLVFSSCPVIELLREKLDSVDEVRRVATG